MKRKYLLSILLVVLLVIFSVPAFAVSSELPSFYTIEENTGGTAPPPEENPNAGFFNTIINWLTSFWDSLKNFVSSIFIPSNDYFSKFFNEISNALSEKVNGLAAVFVSIKDMFSSLNNVTGDSSLSMTIPDNHFYEGYNGVTVNFLTPKISPLLNVVKGVFNSIIVLFTGLICYRKLIAVIRT